MNVLNEILVYLTERTHIIQYVVNTLSIQHYNSSPILSETKYLRCRHDLSKIHTIGQHILICFAIKPVIKAALKRLVIL